jgi:hypothetical protein
LRFEAPDPRKLIAAVRVLMDGPMRFNRLRQTVSSARLLHQARCSSRVNAVPQHRRYCGVLGVVEIDCGMA